MGSTDSRPENHFDHSGHYGGEHGERLHLLTPDQNEPNYTDADLLIQQYLNNEKIRARIGSLSQLKEWFVAHELCSRFMSRTLLDLWTMFYETKKGSIAKLNDPQDVAFAIKAYCNSSCDLQNLITRLYDGDHGLHPVVSDKDIVEGFIENGFVKFDGTMEYCAKLLTKLSFARSLTKATRSEEKKTLAQNFMISIMDRLKNISDDTTVNYLTVCMSAANTKNVVILKYLIDNFPHIDDHLKVYNQGFGEYHSVVQTEYSDDKIN